MTTAAAPCLPIQNRSEPTRAGGLAFLPNRRAAGTAKHSGSTVQRPWADYTPTWDLTPTPWATHDSMAQPSPGALAMQTSGAFANGRIQSDDEKGGVGPERSPLGMWPATPTPSAAGGTALDTSFGFGMSGGGLDLVPPPMLQGLPLQPPPKVAAMAAAAAAAAAGAAAAAAAAVQEASPCSAYREEELEDMPSPVRTLQAAVVTSSSRGRGAAASPVQVRARPAPSAPFAGAARPGATITGVPVAREAPATRVPAGAAPTAAVPAASVVPTTGKALAPSAAPAAGVPTAAPTTAQGPSSAPLPPGMPSRGSALHGTGRCRPCAWFWKEEKCHNLEDCGYCHLCPEGELKMRKKSKVAAMRMGVLTPAKGGGSTGQHVLKLSPLL